MFSDTLADDIELVCDRSILLIIPFLTWLDGKKCCVGSSRSLLLLPIQLVELRGLALRRCSIPTRIHRLHQLWPGHDTCRPKHSRRYRGRSGWELALGFYGLWYLPGRAVIFFFVDIIIIIIIIKSSEHYWAKEHEI